MTEQMLIVFGVLAGAVGLFAWGRLRADIVAILVVLALMLSRVLTPQESLAGFGDPVVILIAAIFIHDQPKHDWSLRNLAAVSGMSLTTLVEQFQAVLGTSPIRYVRERRLYLASCGASTGCPRINRGD